MSLIILYREYPTWPIAPVVVFSLTAAAVLFSIFRGSTYRTLLVCSALIAVISQLLCAILILVDFNTIHNPFQLVLPYFHSLKPVYHLFEAIYGPFMFVPGLIAFGRISKKRNSKIGVLISYFGYVWTIAVIIVGLALMIYILTELPDGDDFFDTIFNSMSPLKINSTQLEVCFKMSDFTYFSVWALVVTSLIHHVTQFGALKGKARNSLIAYSTLNIIAVIFNTAVPFMLRKVSEYSQIIIAIVITLVFVHITSCIAILLAAQYGHLWDTDEIQVGPQDLDIEKSQVPDN
ncbi:hypothetical protein HPULCUR_007375 [Helicostylum pulchrum]|uniref:Uncharacterized protein n=1 Tax=Helicostylum pulchrum TaxID=562976 RepID=A0ABP9Y4K4_9FUNG